MFGGGQRRRQLTPAMLPQHRIYNSMPMNNWPIVSSAVVYRSRSEWTRPKHTVTATNFLIRKFRPPTQHKSHAETREYCGDVTGDVTRRWRHRQSRASGVLSLRAWMRRWTLDSSHEWCGKSECTLLVPQLAPVLPCNTRTPLIIPPYPPGGANVKGGEGEWCRWKVRVDFARSTASSSTHTHNTHSFHRIRQVAPVWRGVMWKVHVDCSFHNCPGTHTSAHFP